MPDIIEKVPRRCPICRNSEEIAIRKWKFDNGTDNEYRFYVECTRCTVTGDGLYKTMDDAIDGWNRGEDIHVRINMKDLKFQPDTAVWCPNCGGWTILTCTIPLNYCQNCGEKMPKTKDEE